MDRAKGVLQTEHGLGEPDAFRWIQQAAMDQRRSMRAVAQDVVDGLGVSRREQVGRPSVAFGSAQVFPDPARSLLGSVRVLPGQNHSVRG